MFFNFFNFFCTFIVLSNNVKSEENTIIFTEIDISGDGNVQLAITKTLLFAYSEVSGWVQQESTGLENQLYVDISLDGTLYSISNSTHWNFYYSASFLPDGSWQSGILYSTGSFPLRLKNMTLKDYDDYDYDDAINDNYDFIDAINDNFDNVPKEEEEFSIPDNYKENVTQNIEKVFQKKNIKKLNTINIESIGVYGNTCINDLSCSFGDPFAQIYIGTNDANLVFTTSSTVPIGWETTNLNSCSISHNGSVWLLSSHNGIRLSWNYGLSWMAPELPEISIGNRLKINNGDISFDGKYMTIVAGNSVIVSYNYGANWNIVRTFLYPPISSSINTDGTKISIISIFLVNHGSNCSILDNKFQCSDWQSLSIKPNPISYLFDPEMENSHRKYSILKVKDSFFLE